MRRSGSSVNIISIRTSIYSTNRNDYKLLEEVGYGASAIVHRAIYLPTNEVVAVKALDLDRCNNNLDDIRREAQTMSLIEHPNVIRAFCSFVVEKDLWVVMPFMAEGSCLHLMKTAYQDGFEEVVIASILKETLKALEYLHHHGHIHRDVKAGNILLDTNGVVKLGDFGVSAGMFDNGDRKRSRNTFVGTPCWMAPEVLQPGSGYDFKADIWSFGITALELAHGHAPFSKYPPMKVLLMTIQNAPPGLDYDRDRKFSKSFKEMVAMCLVKDQTKRPTAEKLLKHPIFKNVKPPEVTVKNLLTDLPPLWERVKALQLKDAAQLALKKMPSSEQEAMSQSEYKRGVSAWNFDVEDLKAQASLVQDYEDLSSIKETGESMRVFSNEKEASSSASMAGKSVLNGIDLRGSINGAEFLQPECSNTKGNNLETGSLDSCNPRRTESYENFGSVNGIILSAPEKDSLSQVQSKTQTCNRGQSRSGPLVPNTVLSHSLSERVRVAERCESECQSATEKGKQNVRRNPSFSGPLMLPNKASGNSYSAPIRSSGYSLLDDKSKPNLVQVKGRFSVTSENIEHMKDTSLSTAQRRPGSPLRKSASVGDWLLDSKQVPINQSPKEVLNSVIPAAVILPHLQNLFQQTAAQQDLIMNILSSLQQQSELQEGGHNAKLPPLPRPTENGVETASDRERLLLLKIAELQNRLINITDELTAEKLKHMRLQKQLSEASASEEDDGSRRGEHNN